MAWGWGMLTVWIKLDLIRGESEDWAWPTRTAHAKQPPRAGELRHALAMEIRLPNPNSDNAPLIGTF